MFEHLIELYKTYYVIWIFGSHHSNHMVYAFVGPLNGEKHFCIIKLVKDKEFEKVNACYTWLSLVEFAEIVQKMENERMQLVMPQLGRDC